MTIDLKVNGVSHVLEVDPWVTLLEVLRSRLRLIGTKEGCGTGDCGACIVLMDGKPVNSCLVLAADAKGKEILTIEGLGQEAEMDPLQISFIKKGAVQCGFCSSAMILSAKALLEENPVPDVEEIGDALTGVLCRCGSYVRIIDAVRSVAEVRKSESGSRT